LKLRGIGASPGVAVGKALVLETRETTIYRMPVSLDEVEGEIQRFHQARDAAREQILRVKESVEKNLGESYARIFDAQIQILEDESLSGETAKRIKDEMVNAEWALRSVVRRFLEFFEKMEDPYLKERGGDIEDVHSRVQTLLAGNRDHHDLSELTEDTIIIAHSLAPSDAAMLHQKRVVGMAIDVGGRTSHTAILAQALGVAAVVGLHDATQRIKGGDLLILDGEAGTVEISPLADSLADHDRRRAEIVTRESQLLAQKDLPSTTTDGRPITLLANIEFPEEIATAQRFGASGVGLYRSEFLFLTRSPDLPSEEEHRQLYADLALRMGDGEAVVRTLDLGGEKYFHAVLDKEGSNPVLGLRAIRFCLKRTDIFRTQLRGLLRASVQKNLRVMLPLISGVGELRAAKKILDEVRAELRAEGVPFNEDLELGIMIEVPSAAMVSDLLAREVRFFSIGTNDLIQYALAIDRGNESVAYLYQPLHPAILRLLSRVVASARAGGIDVSLCGEMASDPMVVPVLIGLGIHKLSMNSTAIPAVRSMVRRISATEAEALVERLLAMPTAEEIEKALQDWLVAMAPELVPPAGISRRQGEEVN
jgi:phosphotransferase system enzyme I (PtsI)